MNGTCIVCGTSGKPYAHDCAITLKNQLDAALAERGEARALLFDCWKAIYTACMGEDGLDGSDGMPLLERIEAVCPEAKAKADWVAKQPVT